MNGMVTAFALCSCEDWRSAPWLADAHRSLFQEESKGESSAHGHENLRRSLSSIGTGARSSKKVASVHRSHVGLGSGEYSSSHSSRQARIAQPAQSIPRSCPFDWYNRSARW